MTKTIKTITASLLLFLASCQEKSSNGYELTDVQNFEPAINQTQNVQLIDVRTPQEFSEGHINNAINMDWNATDFENQVATLDKNQPVYLYCLSGGRSKKASDKLTELGFSNIIELEGGYLSWSKAHQSDKQNDQYKMADFEKIIAEQPIVLIDFYADWCAPCKIMAPYIEQFKIDYQNQIKIIKIDADKNKQLVTDLGYEALPIILLYNKGEKVFEQEGLVEENMLRELLNAQLK